uniref:Glutamate receptor n=1 Tax=Syphacia muris TaxID=451379 RepID=A0A0N5AJG7_9BILA
MASQTGIPIIAWNADSYAYSFERNPAAYRILQLAPPIEHQIRAMIALLKRYKWSKFGVVTSKNRVAQSFIHYLQILLEENKGRPFKLELLYHAEVANQTGLISKKYLWIATQSVKADASTFKLPFQPGMLAITFNTHADAYFDQPNDILSVIIALAPKVLHKFQKIVEHLFRAMRKTAIKGNPHHSKDGLHSFFYIFDEHGKLKNSHLIVSNFREKTNKDFPKNNNILVWDPVGEYTNGELKIADIEWPGGIPNPPQGTPDQFHVKVVTLHEPPFLIVTDLDPETGNCIGNQGSICDWGDEVYIENGVKKNRTLYKCCTGYCVDLLEKLAKDIGFTYTLYKVRDEKWGIKMENGWNGLIQDLILHKADMCVTSLKLNSERARDIDFSIPFLETGITIIVKIRSGVLSPTAFLEPFEYSTWVIILLISIQGAAFSIFVFEWVSPYSFNMQKHPPPGHKFSLCRSYWLVWATFFSASVSTDVPRSTVSRFMALVWAAFGLTFLAVYTANLAAFMITRVQYYDLQGIHDPRLLYPDEQKPPFRYGTVEGGNTHETMKRNWLLMNQYVTSRNYFRANVSAGIEAVKKEELSAFIYDAVVLDYLAGKDPKCELITVGKWSSMTGYGIGFPKNSPYVQKVNQFMLQYQQKGDLERLQNFWLTGACVPDSHSQTKSAPLGIENFMSAFILLFVGMAVGMLVLGSEHIYCNHLRKYLQNVDNGWCGIISMAMGKSLTFTEAVNRVSEWQQRKQTIRSPAMRQKSELSAKSSSATANTQEYSTGMYEEKVPRRSIENHKVLIRQHETAL